MLTSVEVSPSNCYTLWKPASDKTERVAVEPGRYYVVHGRMSDANRTIFKNRMAPLAAEDPRGTFCWLLPYEPWVKAVWDGRLELPKQNTTVDSEETREELAEYLGVKVKLIDKLRAWQRRGLYDFRFHRKSGKTEYRYGKVVRIGGGKTLFGLLLARTHEHAIALAPSYCWDSWRKEADKWDLECPQLSTYQSAHKITEKLDGKTVSPGGGVDLCLLMDEVLLVANPNTKVFGNALSLSRYASTCVGLTGTPRSTTPMDLRWLRAITPGCVPADEKPWRYLFGVDTELKEVRPGTSAYVTKTWNEDAVSKFVAPYLTVVKPEEVLAELPDITYQQITVPKPSQYDLILRGAATEKGKSKAWAQARMCTDGCITNDAGQVLARLDSAKLDAIADFVQTLGEPAVIFSRWSYMVEDLSQRFAGASVVRGGADNAAEVSKFTDGHSNILIAQADLCQGMNLQERARVVIFTSNSLKPTAREQAIGRVWRPGQTKGVIVVDVLAQDTLDAPALALLERHKDRNEAYIESALLREFERQVKTYGK